MKRITEIIGMSLVSAVFLLGVATLYNNHDAYFNEIAEAYKKEKRETINLDQETSQKTLSKFLQTRGYVNDPGDAAFAAKHIHRLLQEHGELVNLGELNQSKNRVSAQEIAAHGGPDLKKRLKSLNDSHGVPETEPALVECKPDAPYRIKVVVSRADSAGGVTKLINKLTGRSRYPVEGVLVRLKEHTMVMENPNDSDEMMSNFAAADTVVAWAKTDSKGVAWLPVQKGHYYSVVPVTENFDYGREKGTTKSEIVKPVTEFSFVQKDIKLPVFSSSTFSQIKEDRAFTVRTPEQWRNSVVLAVAMFLLAWWFGYVIISRIDARAGRKSDHLVYVILMALTALGLLAMFSISDPLVDLLLGFDTALGVVFGVAALCVMSSVNYIDYYNSHSKVQRGIMKFDFVSQFLTWVAKPFRCRAARRVWSWLSSIASWISMPFMAKLKGLKVRGGSVAVGVLKYYAGLLLSVLLLPLQWLFQFFKWLGGKELRWPEGIGYLLLALVLVVLLRIFGTGPEGSDARVNLWFFQPSELSKYLVVTFIAAFFAVNAKQIQSYAHQLTGRMAKSQFSSMVVIVLAMLVLLAMYLVLVSDMGPALVLMVTFIFLYSIARGDFGQLVIGVITFILMIVVADKVNPTLITKLVFIGAWFVVWVAVGYARGKRLYESAIIMNLLILVFLFGGELLTSMGMSEGDRLSNRIDGAWDGVWNNDVPGGDQVVQGLWGLATGGLTGQGLGKGNPNAVPAFHTDMIFTSIGEIMGWVTLLLIVVCVAVLLHRCLLIARQNAHPFAFYLVSGIAIVTGVQFFVIVLGSLGLIPLTGVSVPLLSYGKSSLIINLAMFGIIVSCSRRKASAIEKKNVRGYDSVVVSASLAFIGLSLVLLSVLFYYQVYERDQVLVRPAYVADMEGTRIQEYNPRIVMLMNRLHAGNIYDRNGLLLATSDVQELKDKAKASRLEANGAKDVATQASRKQSRYYPFAEQLFFMVGDYNTRLLWNNNDSDPYGYMAESRHLAELRGFDNLARDEDGHKAEKVVVKAKKYRVSRFLPTQEKEYCYTKYDYSNPMLIEMLKTGGPKSPMVKAWNEKRAERDMKLTVDAKLQCDLQNAIVEFVKNDGQIRNLKRVRASVVVLDAKHGDLLASACYPLPNQKTIAEEMSKSSYYRDTKAGMRAYTDRDLGLTFQTQPGSTAKVMSALAAFRKFGDEAANITINNYAAENVHPGDDGSHNIHDAIVHSSNTFFVSLVNSKDLYEDLDVIYRMVGIRVSNAFSKNSVSSYYFDLDTAFLFGKDMELYGSEMEVMRKNGVEKYNRYVNGPRRRGQYQKMRWWQTGNAWGQHNILATPLAMARVAQIVALNGYIVPTRYVLSVGSTTLPPEGKIKVLGSTSKLKEAMKAQASGRFKNYVSSNEMGGKTGTPERSAGKKARPNDAWYMFFVNTNNGDPIAVAVRIERTGRVDQDESGSATSTKAMQMTNDLMHLFVGIEKL